MGTTETILLLINLFVHNDVSVSVFTQNVSKDCHLIFLINHYQDFLLFYSTSYHLNFSHSSQN